MPPSPADRDSAEAGGASGASPAGPAAAGPWRMLLGASYRQARRIVIGVVGFTVLLLGVVMVVAPGPALVVIPLGLAILALEFAWARRWLHRIRAKAKETRRRIRERGGR